MKYVVNDNLEGKWYDEILCVCWMPNMERIAHSLSKRKLLRYFSELQKIDEFHILLLNNLSRISSFRHYVGETGVTIALAKGQTIAVDIPESVFEDIVTAAKIEQG